MQDNVALAKAQRLNYICHLLYRHPRGLTVSELGHFCGVAKRTIQRDLRSLDEMNIPLWDDAEERASGKPPRYGIIEGYYLPPIHLSLDDALALYLAARLLARYADSFDPHITEALSKLAGIMPEAMARHVHMTIQSLATRQRDERFVRVLGVLAVAWATGRVAHIHHRAAGSENVHEYDFCPYFIEPSGTGNATYAIGYASYFEALHTFKVERILKAELTAESFEIPETFDGPSLLSNAWGIMYGGEPEGVVLRFAPSATRRIKETRWHPSQSLEETPDGGCILRLEITHPKEMVYWIRGWGPQVVVMAPDWLRERIAREARETARVYEREGR